MEFEEGLEPVSPTGQYFNSSVLSVSIIAVMEFEIPINNLPSIMSLVKDVFLPINPRFSSIMVTGEKGEKQWKRVEVKLEDHINVPIFPIELSPGSYDEYFDDYISKIAMNHFPQNKPLWEIHIVKYPTSNASGTIIFKLHHALGDGYSLMGALLSSMQRADNPSLPLTFPFCQRSESKSDRLSRGVSQLVSLIFNTIHDFGWSMLKSNLIEDDRTPIRSGEKGVEFRPITISTMTFSLDHIKFIKDKLGVTINDVITGIIFFGTRLYMQEVSQKSSKADSTAIVLLSTRTVKGYKSVKEMIKPESDTPWGNQFGLLHVSIPKFTNLKSSNPLEFVLKVHKIIRKKRNSSSVYFTGCLLSIMKKLKGPEAASKYIHRASNYSSMSISNMIGPVEQMALVKHPVKGLYFMTVKGPQSLTITMVSYMGNLRVAVGSEKGFLDPHKFKSCVINAFEMTLQAAHDIPT
ncbi:wax ester synthase/diacylglycerol acyltransferase 4-like [Quercus robur]|uniref:wax ester synthase/diacylglycerol acyltransferase 4-like n=1 Tax=Quercus robur TaxID=38942 RepID=UPI002163D902|nr:wax ester synthase/diacylglycerol acyltransferase 4-like [Quercus robur]